MSTGISNIVTIDNNKSYIVYAGWQAGGYPTSWAQAYTVHAVITPQNSTFTYDDTTCTFYIYELGRSNETQTEDPLKYIVPNPNQNSLIFHTDISEKDDHDINFFARGFRSNGQYLDELSGTLKYLDKKTVVVKDENGNVKFNVDVGNYGFNLNETTPIRTTIRIY